MTVVVNSSDIYLGNYLVNNTFNVTTGGFNGGIITEIAAFKGAMPNLPTITTDITKLHASNVSVVGKWFAPSDGVSILSSPIVFTPNSSGTLSFVRLYRTGVPLIDISCGLSGSGDSAIASTLNVVSGTPFGVTDLRMRIACEGNVSVSPSVANYFLAKLNGSATYPYDANGLNAFSRYNSWGEVRSIIIDIYDGAIPSRADQTPTGTKLWTKTISTGNGLFVQSTNFSLVLGSAQTANAIATGVPTYCRVRKAGYTTSASGPSVTYPECVLQVPVSNASSGCIVSDGTFTSGQSYTITNLTLTLNPS